MKPPAVFLDRDGVLNRALVRDGRPYPPSNLGEVEICADVPIYLDLLKKAGYLLVAVTNQPDVGRGTGSREMVEAINEHLCDRLPLDAIFTCYEDGDSPRRKPNPGLLAEAAEIFDIDPARSFLVGDRWKDVEAGRRFGCATAFIDYDYREPRPDPPATYTAPSAAEALAWVLRQQPTSARHQALPVKVSSS